MEQADSSPGRVGNKECFGYRTEVDENMGSAPNCSLLGLKDVYKGYRDMELMRAGQSKMEVNQLYPDKGVSEEQVWDGMN